MRYLAVARLRLMTAVRQATPILLIAAVPPTGALLFEAMPEPLFRASADEVLETMARAAMLAWLIHGAILVVACEAFGTLQLMRPGSSAAQSDLLDSAPIGHLPRFWGEALGIFATTLSIHLCCLPLLATAAILSPLPTIFFAGVEAVTIAFVALGSAVGASKRLAPVTRWSATRSARSGALFVTLFLAALLATTEWEKFRDAIGEFLIVPSVRHWAAVTSAIARPSLLAILIAILYGGYILFFVRSARTRAEA